MENFIQSDQENVKSLLFESFIEWIKKLNENTLRPFLIQLVDWMDNDEKQFLIYSLLEKCLIEFKGLFVPMFKSIQQNISILLQSNPNPVLLKLLLNTLNLFYLYDKQDEMHPSFDTIVPILFDIIPSLDYDFIIANLVPLVAQIAVSLHSDSFWKPLNQHILTLATNEDYLLRNVAVMMLSECYNKLGEQFLILLPESIPTIAE
ncbi:hypothetical protein ROZALSC1DRAFT_18117, partial [Rozella allomycis CSF55]